MELAAARTEAEFLSTPSARRATEEAQRNIRNYIFLSTPSARRATPAGIYHGLRIEIFLSTPSARRATIGFRDPPLRFKRFLSTPSARRATAISLAVVPWREISIHALREEGDDIRTVSILSVELFLSTPSARRATG